MVISHNLKDWEKEGVLKMKKMKKLVSVLLVACSIALLAACNAAPSTKPEDKLVGTWYDTDGYHELTFYDDGTYTKTGEYGTGKWSITSDGKLKFVDFYGTTKAGAYEVSEDTLTYTDDYGKYEYHKN